MALRPVETPQEHVRTALHLLGELEDQLRVLGLIMPERYYLVRLLAATRRQLWLAVAARESRRDGLRWWVRPRLVAPKRGWAVMILLEGRRMVRTRRRLCAQLHLAVHPGGAADALAELTD